MKRERLAFRLLAAGLASGWLCACGEPRTNREPAGAAVALAPDADANEAAIKPVKPVDYADKANWLCRPEAQDACKGDLSASVVAADGKLEIEKFQADSKAPIDCFYVYPTVSLDPTPNADMNPGPEEADAARQELARFGAVCRLYAPLYRQVTFPALRQMLAGETPATNREMAYADVKAAWERYLANDNAGRGVVLIGHSQGAGILTRLIANEIEGKPAQSRLVSAILLGGNLAVPIGKAVGGSFKRIGLCASQQEIGCVIAYSSFRADQPPPADAMFGKVGDQGMEAACVNPAELDGSSGALKAYLPSGKMGEAGVEPAPWTTTGPITTPFVSLPGLLAARCVRAAGFAYLAITTNGDPTDPRTDSIPGDIVIGGKIAPGWGLHMIDLPLAIGNLVAIVSVQAKTFAARQAELTAPSKGAP